MSTTLLAHDDFAMHVGSAFAIDDAGERRAACLVEARRLRPRPGPGGRAPFSLLFQTADQRILPQRIYGLHHPVMGRLDIFLVPIGRDAHGVLYEASFN